MPRHGVRLRTGPLPSDGTLVAHLTFDVSRGILELWLDDTQFACQPGGSPTVGRLPLVAGRTYRVAVADGAPWDYGDLEVPFVLATAIETGGESP